MRSARIKEPYWIALCSKVFGIENLTPDDEGTNKFFGGLDIEGENIVFANAVEDPW